MSDTTHCRDCGHYLKPLCHLSRETAAHSDASELCEDYSPSAVARIADALEVLVSIKADELGIQGDGEPARQQLIKCMCGNAISALSTDIAAMCHHCGQKFSGDGSGNWDQFDDGHIIR